jgi:hypothetical protein
MECGSIAPNPNCTPRSGLELPKGQKEDPAQGLNPGRVLQEVCPESTSNPADGGCNSPNAQYSSSPILHHSAWPDSRTRATTRTSTKRPCGSRRPSATSSRQRVGLQLFQGHEFQSRSVCRVQVHWWRNTLFQRFVPASHAKTPAVTFLQSREITLWCHQIVAS